MARKKTPDTSKVTRSVVAAYTRALPSDTKFVVAKKDDKPEAKGKATADDRKSPAPAADDRKSPATADDRKSPAPAADDRKSPAPADPAKIDVKAVAASDGRIDAKFDDVKSGAVPLGAKSSDVPQRPNAGTPNEMPAERPRLSTETMTVVTPIGEPPSVPDTKASAAPPPSARAQVEDPTHMPGPKSIPGGSPTDPALPPGHVPPGDSRSLRRGDEFALVYRQGSSVITRWGTLGQRGQWRVVEYPTTASASNSYAKECSRFVAEGFADYRD